MIPVVLLDRCLSKTCPRGRMPVVDALHFVVVWRHFVFWTPSYPPPQPSIKRCAFLLPFSQSFASMSDYQPPQLRPKIKKRPNLNSACGKENSSKIVKWCTGRNVNHFSIFFFIILIIVIPATTRRFYLKSGDLNITVQSGGIRFLLSRKFLQQRNAKISLPRWLPCQPFYVLATTGASSITVFCYIIIIFFSITIQSSSVPFCIWDSPLPQKCKGKVTFENKIIMPKV